jgi:hypothetical protein
MMDSFFFELLAANSWLLACKISFFVRSVNFRTLGALAGFAPQRATQRHADGDSDCHPDRDVSGSHAKSHAHGGPQRDTPSY